jgi:hypothetical protein
MPAVCPPCKGYSGVGPRNLPERGRRAKAELEEEDRALQRAAGGRHVNARKELKRACVLVQE